MIWMSCFGEKTNRARSKDKVLRSDSRLVIRTSQLRYSESCKVLCGGSQLVVR